MKGKFKIYSRDKKTGKVSLVVEKTNSCIPSSFRHLRYENNTNQEFKLALCQSLGLKKPLFEYEDKLPDVQKSSLYDTLNNNSELQTIYNEYKQQETLVNNLKSQLTSKQNQIISNTKIIEEKQQENELLKRKQEIQQLNVKFYNDNIKGYLNNISLSLPDKIHITRQNLTKITDEISTLQQQLELLTNQLTTKQEQLQQAQHQYNLNIEIYNNRQDVIDKQSELTQYQTVINELTPQIETLNNDLSSLQQQLEQLAYQVEGKTGDELAQLQSQINAISTSIQDKREQLNIKTTTLNQNLSIIVSIQQQLETIKNTVAPTIDIETITIEINSININIKAYEDSIELKSLEKNNTNDILTELLLEQTKTNNSITNNNQIIDLAKDDLTKITKKYTDNVATITLKQSENNLLSIEVLEIEEQINTQSQILLSKRNTFKHADSEINKHRVQHLKTFMSIDDDIFLKYNPDLYGDIQPTNGTSLQGYADMFQKHGDDYNASNKKLPEEYNRLYTREYINSEQPTTKLNEFFNRCRQVYMSPSVNVTITNTETYYTLPIMTVTTALIDRGMVNGVRTFFETNYTDTSVLSPLYAIEPLKVLSQQQKEQLSYPFIEQIIQPCTIVDETVTLNNLVEGTQSVYIKSNVKLSTDFEVEESTDIRFISLIVNDTYLTFSSVLHNDKVLRMTSDKVYTIEYELEYIEQKYAEIMDYVNQTNDTVNVNYMFNYDNTFDTSNLRFIDSISFFTGFGGKFNIEHFTNDTKPREDNDEIVNHEVEAYNEYMYSGYRDDTVLLNDRYIPISENVVKLKENSNLYRTEIDIPDGNATYSKQRTLDGMIIAHLDGMSFRLSNVRRRENRHTVQDTHYTIFDNPSLSTFKLEDVLYKDRTFIIPVDDSIDELELQLYRSKFNIFTDNIIIKPVSEDEFVRLFNEYHQDFNNYLMNTENPEKKEVYLFNTKIIDDMFAELNSVIQETKHKQGVSDNNTDRFVDEYSSNILYDVITFVKRVDIYNRFGYKFISIIPSRAIGIFEYFTLTFSYGNTLTKEIKGIYKRKHEVNKLTPYDMTHGLTSEYVMDYYIGNDSRYLRIEELYNDNVNLGNG